MTRESISAEGLHLLLVEALQRQRIADCVLRCRMPMPVFRADGDGDGANWTLPDPPRCPRYCHDLIRRIGRELGARYRLAVEGALDAT